MNHRVTAIDLLVRPLPPDRFDFVIGEPRSESKQVNPSEGSAPARRAPAVVLCRLTLEGDDGRSAIGCSGDRLSYGWLDKRDDRTPLNKLRSLVDLLEGARDIWLEQPEFDQVFPHWLERHGAIKALADQTDHEELSGSFASALFERAVCDAVCRLEGLTIFEAISKNRFGIAPGRVHPELDGVQIQKWLPTRPRTRFSIRHTVGLDDPLTAADLKQRVNDGEPETLAEYAERDGLNHYKIKISGNADEDIDRLQRIWETIPISSTTVLTLDGNESYSNIARFGAFVSRLEYEAPGLYQHIHYIEQPMPRSVSLDPENRRWIRRIAEQKPLIIDEADGRLSAFREASEIGYAGVSHKNCKGFFKSLLNHALCRRLADRGEWAFLSGEDLSTLPIVPLQQDFAALGVLGLRDCERNGHHYGYGLSHLGESEKVRLLEHHDDLYERRGDEVFLRIVDGSVDCTSLQVAGFGVADEAMPAWDELEPMHSWLDQHYPAAPSAPGESTAPRSA